MENHWQKLWNNRQINFDDLNAQDEQRLIIELKRIVGWDFHGKGSSIVVEEFKKEYEYLKANLDLSDKIIRGWYLKLAVEAVPISIFSRKTALKLAVWITLRIWSLSQGKLSEQKI